MNRSLALAALLLAAILEAVGDALVRIGLHSHALVWRALLFVAGAAVLFLYGLTVNTPPWDFGRLLGLYIVFFVVIAQLLSWLVFHQPPSRGVLLGCALIVAGGLVISLVA